MALIKSLLLLTVFLTPLLGAGFSLGYEQIKVLFFILSITLIGFLWLFLKPKFKLTFVSLASSLTIGILFLTSLTGLNPQISFLGNYPYFQGWILYIYLFLFSLFVRESKIKIEHWAKVLTLASVIVSFLAIKDWLLLNLFQIKIPNYAGRVVSSFGQPNFYAGFLLLCLPFSYYLTKSSNKKLNYLGVVGGLISIIAIFVSYSRTAIFLLLSLTYFYLILRLSRVKRWIVVLFLTLIFSISLLTSFYLRSGIIYKEFLEPSFTAGNVTNPILNSVEKRAYIWPVLINLSLQKPFLGYGLENIAPSFTNYFIERKHILFEETNSVSDVLIRLKDLSLDRTHNYILDLMLFSGLFGVICWLLLVFALLKKILSSNITLENDVLLSGLVIYLIWIQFQNQSIAQLVYFWFLVGMIDKDNH